MMRSAKSIAEEITNIRYDDNKVAFDVNGITYRISDPVDVMLVGFAGSAEWIAKNYGYLVG